MLSTSAWKKRNHRLGGLWIAAIRIFFCSGFTNISERQFSTKRFSNRYASPSNQYDVLDEIRQLNAKLREYDFSYYNLETSQVSDVEYDHLKSRLKRLQTQIDEVDLKSADQTEVGAPVKEGLACVKHLKPCLSLDNANSPDEVRNFIKRIFKATEETQSTVNPQKVAVVAEPKVDGFSAILKYHHGHLENASTRGDGINGEDISKSLLLLKSIPHRIDTEEENIEVRGEVYLPVSDFLKLNEERLKRNEPTFTTPRNAAAGTVRSLDDKLVESRGLSFFAYDIAVEDKFSNISIDSNFQLKYLLGTWKFLTPPYSQYFESNKEELMLDMLLQYQKNLEDKRNDIPFSIDGVVYKVDKFSIRNFLGAHSRAPRWAIAHKFSAKEGITTIRDLKVQVGRTGILTPVAELDPLKLDGVTISRATLHNADELERLQLRLGDSVVIRRGGDVIPVIVKKSSTTDSSDNRPILMLPTKCPKCGGEVTRKGNQSGTYCASGHNCQGQLMSRMAHFASKEAMNIKGLGKASIQSLCDSGIVNCSLDLYFLDKEEFCEKRNRIKTMEKWGEKRLDILLDSIQDSRAAKLENFIYSLSIPKVGIESSKILSSFFHGRIENFISCAEVISSEGQGREDVVSTLGNVPRLGKVVAESMAEYFSDRSSVKLLRRFAEVLSFEPSNDETKHVSAAAGKELSVKEKRLAFTGTLAAMTRFQAKNAALELGAMPMSSITKNTDLVIVGSNPSEAKINVIKKYNIKTIGEAEWIALCNN